MKKKILIALLLTFSTLTFTGCISRNNSANINISSEKESGTKQVGLEQLQCIDNSYLYYDINTNIVYFWNGVIGGFSNCATTPSPYYAPNGLPYKYNPSTNTLEEITPEEE